MTFPRFSLWRFPEKISVERSSVERATLAVSHDDVSAVVDVGRITAAFGWWQYSTETKQTAAKNEGTTRAVTAAVVNKKSLSEDVMGVSI